MARSADREKLPGWTVLAAALLADDYDRRAKARREMKHLREAVERIERDGEG
jgi:hypothetical protein